MDLDLARLGGDLSAAKGSKAETLSFSVSPSSFFTALVFNNVLRGPDSGLDGLGSRKIRRPSLLG